MEGHFRRVDEGVYQYGSFNVERNDSLKGYHGHWEAEHMGKPRVKFRARTRKKLKVLMDVYFSQYEGK